MGFRPLQLVAKGNQDIPLVGNPQITFFKSVYKRHTHFASEWINIFSNGNINFGNLFEFTIPRNADLLGETLFTFVLPQISVATGKTVKWVEKIGHAMIDYIEIFIGNNSIVGAGSVVTKSVKNHSLVLGNPARHVGWMSEYGIKLIFDNKNTAICKKSKIKYKLINKNIKKIK